jgi:nucleolar protein TMA23
LHHSSDAIGLTRPILVSKKQNNSGVGKKQHKTSDMWWMNAFDKSLKGLDTSEEGKVVQTVNNTGLDLVKKGGSRFVGAVGLYARFVRGEGLQGTIVPKDQSSAAPAVGAPEKRRSKRAPETKEERRARKAAKRAARAKGAASQMDSAAVSSEDMDATETGKSTGTEEVETKEQRRERRKQRRLAKERATG